MHETKVSGQTFDKVARKLYLITAQQIGSVARKELIDETLSYGWKMFRSEIKQSPIDKDTEMVFITENNNARKIGGYLNFGTIAHGPVRAKVLHWVSGGKDIFAKWVKGIKSYSWWGITPQVITKIDQYISSKIREALS
jgi:hypothetical protein